MKYSIPPALSSRPFEKLLSASLLILTLSGCATESQFRARVNSWRTRETADLIHSWGSPEVTEKLSNGNQILLYIRLKHPPYAFGESHRELASSPNAFQPLRCPTYFEATPAGRIVSVEYRGEECFWK